MGEARQIKRLRKPSFLNLLILMGGEFAARGFTFIAFAYLARTLGQEAYGYVAPAYAVLMFCLLVADFGAATLGTREIAKNPDVAEELVNKVASTQMLIAAALLFLLVAVVLLAPVHFLLGRLLIGFGISLLGIPFLLNWVFQGRNEMFLAAMPLALRQGVFLIITVLIVSEPSDVDLLPFAEIGGIAAAGFVYLFFYARRIGRIRLSLQKSLDKDLMREALPIGGAHFIWALRIYLPVVAVGAIQGTESAGLFDVGHRIVMVFHAFLGVYFTNLLPALSLTSSDSLDEMISLLKRSVVLSVLPSIALGVFVYFAAPSILGIVYGDSFVVTESVRSFAVLTWLVPVLAVRRNGRTALITLNKQNLDFNVSVAGAVIMILLILPLTYSYGIIGCAWAMVISEFISAAMTWAFLFPVIRKDITQTDAG